METSTARKDVATSSPQFRSTREGRYGENLTISSSFILIAVRLIAGIAAAKPAFRLYEAQSQIPFQAPCNSPARGFFMPSNKTHFPLFSQLHLNLSHFPPENTDLKVELDALRLALGIIFNATFVKRRRAIRTFGSHQAPRHESGFARHENACSAGFTKEFTFLAMFVDRSSRKGASLTSRVSPSRLGSLVSRQIIASSRHLGF